MYKFDIHYDVVESYSVEANSEADAIKQVKTMAEKLANLYPKCKSIKIKKNGN